MQYKDILVPYDDSEPSKRAFDTALDIAKKFESTITVVHCIEAGESRDYWYTDSRYEEAIRKKIKKKIQQKISKLEISAKKTTYK